MNAANGIMGPVLTRIRNRQTTLLIICVLDVMLVDDIPIVDCYMVTICTTDKILKILMFYLQLMRIVDIDSIQTI